MNTFESVLLSILHYGDQTVPGIPRCIYVIYVIPMQRGMLIQFGQRSEECRVPGIISAHVAPSMAFAAYFKLYQISLEMIARGVWYSLNNAAKNAEFQGMIRAYVAPSMAFLVLFKVYQASLAVISRY